MIKKIILTLSFVIFFSANATAGMSCKYDYLGNTIQPFYLSLKSNKIRINRNNKLKIYQGIY